MRKEFTCTIVPDGLVLAGRFDMDAHGSFRSAYRKVLANWGDKPLRLDMDGVDYLDSSALGMLLLLHKEAEARRLAVILANCKPFVRNVLRTANFDRIFNLTAA